ncbi:MAG: response regulator [Rhodospirillaceae bacterium]|nr:response regulator [Rhodospirillaceae bacterium]
MKILRYDVLPQKLDALGYRSAEARTGKEALDMVVRDPPDLILLDVMMLVMDGLRYDPPTMAADIDRETARVVECRAVAKEAHR